LVSLIAGRKKTFLNTFPAKFDSVIQVHTQSCARGAPDRGPANEPRAVPAEMMAEKAAAASFFT